MPLRVVYGLIDKGLLHASRLFIEGEAPKGWPVRGRREPMIRAQRALRGRLRRLMPVEGGREPR